MAKHRTEDVYDTEIAPLMAAILDICRREGLPMFATFGMLGDDGDEMACTSMIVDGTHPLTPGLENRILLCSGIVQGHSGFNTASRIAITGHHAPKIATGEA